MEANRQQAMGIKEVKHSCYGCENRTPDCHGTCESYQAFRADRERIYHERTIKNISNADVRAGIRARTNSFIKRKARGGHQ